MIDFKEILKKPYHFTLERLDPENENVPEAIIPDDMNLHFTAEEMLMLRRFYKERGRDVEFEEFEGFDEDSYEDDCDILLQYLYMCTSKEMQDYYGQLDWYENLNKTQDEVNAELTTIEYQNKEMLTKERDSRVKS